MARINLIKTTVFKIAERKSKCNFIKTHPINMGDKYMEVSYPGAFKNTVKKKYCMNCADAIIQEAIKQ